MQFQARCFNHLTFKQPNVCLCVCCWFRSEIPPKLCFQSEKHLCEETRRSVTAKGKYKKNNNKKKKKKKKEKH